MENHSAKLGSTVGGVWVCVLECGRGVGGVWGCGRGVGGVWGVLECDSPGKHNM